MLQVCCYSLCFLQLLTQCCSICTRSYEQLLQQPFLCVCVRVCVCVCVGGCVGGCERV